MKRIVLKFAVLGCMMIHSATGVCSTYYSVSVDEAKKTTSESKWHVDDGVGTWAPQTLTQIASHGVMLPLPSQRLVKGVAWEVDLGVLQLDGNILHLLGTATVSGVTTMAQRSIATLSVDLTGTQNSDCHTTLQLHVDADSQQLLVEKLHFVCLGEDVRVAMAALPKE